MAEAAGALYGVESLIEGVAALGKGIYDPTLPVKATLKEIEDIQLPVFWGCLQLIKGWGYGFSGLVENKELLVDTSTHVFHFPTTDTESTDYDRVSPDEATPSPRYGHAGTSLGDGMYIYGGSDAPFSGPRTPIQENGKVHVFDTRTDTWTTLTPATSVRPPNTVFATAIATEEPRPASENSKENDPNPKFSTKTEDLLPKDDVDPEDDVPEPEAELSGGTFIIYGGITDVSESSNEIWAFDIASRIWSQLPSPPVTKMPTNRPNLAIVGNRLYTYADNVTYYLDLDLRSPTSTTEGTTNLGVSPLGPWSSMTAPPGSGPGVREGAGLVPVTTGQGRNYLILVGGDERGDIWAQQLKPEGMSAASFKDAARMAVGKDTGEGAWAEVKYYDVDGELIQEGQEGRGVGRRHGAMFTKNGDADGAGFLVWGGIDGDYVRPDGVMVGISV